VAAAIERERQEQRGSRVLPKRIYFLSAAVFSVGALDADFAIDVVGTMMWAYGVPFHICGVCAVLTCVRCRRMLPSER
jgi:hypothetical protein